MGIFDRFRKQAAVLQPQAPTTRADPRRFAVIDVETTGLRAQEHRVLEIAVVTTDVWGRVLDEWATRLNPQGPVGATHIHGIRDVDVARAPTFSSVIGDLNRRLAGAAVVAHHARFDLAFLRAEYRRAGWELPHVPALCTLQASEHHLPRLERRRLADCCWAVGAPLTQAHSALGDARATAGLLAAFMHPHIGMPPLPEHVELPGQALEVPWPTRPTASPRAVLPVSAGRPAPPPRVRVAMAEQVAAGPGPTLIELVERFSLVDAVDEGAPKGAVPYLEKLAEVLEDGEITVDESANLASVGEALQLTTADIAAANQAFVLALAHAALQDGKVTRAERKELQSIAAILGVNDKLIPRLLDRAENARSERLSEGLAELPDDWTLGEPLRVGDKVVFTGCDDVVRTRLEADSERLGVRVIGGVSAKTAMLVTDGTFTGTKAAKAQELGTRTVDPQTYAVLLRHLQPARRRQVAPRSAAPRYDAPQQTSKMSQVASLTPAPPDNLDPAVVRAWARDHGFEVGVRGRLPSEVLDAFREAQGNAVQ